MDKMGPLLLMKNNQRNLKKFHQFKVWGMSQVASKIKPRVVQQILKKGALCKPPGWPTNKFLGFRWSKQAKITLETINFWKIFLSVFSNFLHFYIQFFKIYKRFYKKKEKTLIQTLFYNSYFMKPSNMTLIIFSSIGLFVHSISLFRKLVRNVIFAF